MSILLRRISELESENYNLYCTIEQCNGRIEELESEIKRLYGALEEIKHTVTSAQSPVCSFHFDLDSKDGAFILETAENALKGIK